MSDVEYVFMLVLLMLGAHYLFVEWEGEGE